MERKKWWASLIAVAVGLALSVGSASAYEQGDFAEGDADDAVNSDGKLIPYYKAGDNTATIIAVENQAGLNGTNTTTSGQVSIIEVRAVDKMGAVQAIGQLCLASNQFGYAVLKEDMMMDDMDSMAMLMVGVGDDMRIVPPGVEPGTPNRAGSAMPGDSGDGGGIEPMGYVVLTDLGTHTTADPQPATPVTTDDGCDSTGDPAPNANSKFAAWAILQDVGEGSFFGTEIPTATVGTGENITPVTADKDRVTCATPADCGGLILPAATVGNPVTVRFDNDMANDSMSTVYVWMDNHTVFQGDSGTRAGRELNAMVYCEGAAAAEPMRVNVPDRVNMLEGSMFGCEARGTAIITLLAGDAVVDAANNTIDANNRPTGVMIWSHISQDGGGFRMNFLGYEDIQS